MPDQKQMIRRQQLLADFGDFALRSQDLDEVLTEACRLVAEALNTKRAKVLEIQKDGGELLVRAGVGWAPGIVGQVRLLMTERSSESFSIQAGKPVFTRDVRADDRFEVPAFMKKAGVVAMANVPIFVPGPQAYGLLQVDATEPRDFGEEDTQFLRTYATILGPVIDRLLKVERLHSSEERFRAFVTATSDVVYRMSPDWTEMRHLDGQGFLADTVEPNQSWMESYIEPDDRDVVQKAIGRAIRTKSIFELEHRVRRADGAIGWTLSRAMPILDPQGEIAEWLGAARDVTERRQSEEGLQVLVAELQHRTRNLIAVVGSIFDQTARSSDRLEVFKTQFKQRLESLARVQGLLSQANQNRITLGTLLRSELDAMGAGDMASRVTLSGPEVPLRNSVVQTLALALHELATNACKYGALVTDAGRIDVKWSAYTDAQGRRRVELVWTESGVDMAWERESPVTKSGGYGREMIERALPYALGAKTTYTIVGDGVRCTIDIPLNRRQR